MDNPFSQCVENRQAEHVLHLSLQVSSIALLGVLRLHGAQHSKIPILPIAMRADDHRRPKNETGKLSHDTDSCWIKDEAER